MKKFVKIMLILATAFLAVGIGFSIAGAAMGATVGSVKVLKNIGAHVSWNKFVETVDGNWDEDDGWDEDDRGKKAVASRKNGSTKVYEIALAEELEIDLKYDELILKEYDGDTIKVEVTNDSAGKVSVKSDDHELKITSTGRKNDRSIQVSYPKGSTFKNLDIEVDAGTVGVSGTIYADEFSVTVGAGEFTGNGDITARECDIEVGAGEISLSKLDAYNISGECGMGSMKLGLKGKETDYDYRLECGIGEISIGNSEYSGLGTEKSINNGTDRILELECGMGEITVTFEN